MSDKMKCTHSKYKAYKYKKQVFRKCKSCGKFCKVGSKRRADQILEVMETYEEQTQKVWKDAFKSNFYDKPTEKI